MFMNTYTCPHGFQFEHYCEHTRDWKEVLKEDIQLSDCCKFQVEGKVAVDGTRWIMCTFCGKSCNVAKTEDLQHKEIDMSQKYTQESLQYMKMRDFLTKNHEFTSQEILQFFTPVPKKKEEVVRRKIEKIDWEIMKIMNHMGMIKHLTLKHNELIDAVNSLLEEKK